MSNVAEPIGSADAAVANAARLLGTQPALAIEQAAEILKVVPDHPAGTLLLGVARRACGETAAAALVLERLVNLHPRWALAHYELGVTWGVLGRGDRAIQALQQALQLKPDLADAWLALAGAVAIVLGAWQSMRDERTSLYEPSGAPPRPPPARS